VVEALDVDALTADVLASLPIPPGTERLLFKTRSSELWNHAEDGFVEDFVAVTGDGAQWLVDRGVRLVGIDYLSIAPFTAPVPCHQILLAAGVIPVEGLDLRRVEPGLYQLICLPIKIGGSDGAPCRAVLVG